MLKSSGEFMTLSQGVSPIRREGSAKENFV
jgi:hypothetical protein